MDLNIYLILNNILLIISGVLALGIALFTYLNGRHKEVNIVFALLLLSATVFLISHAIGINVTDPEISRQAFMWNLCMFFAAAFQVHSILALIGKSREKRWLIIFIYISAAVFVILFSIFPDLFLLSSRPKMYYTNYYVPGVFNWTRIAFLDAIAVFYSMYMLAKELFAETIKEKRKQYTYLFWSYLFGYVFIFIPNFLVYDIQIDPIWGMLWSPIFIGPFLFGAIRYGALSIRVIAKQAFFYGVAIAVIGGFITLFNYSNVWIHELFPAFPLWINALISSIFAVTLGVFVWKRLREDDLLKYEFISTVTHKFRTPLTHIKWASENLEKENLSQEGRDQIKYITKANMNLVELTNILAKASEVDADPQEYHVKLVDVSALVESVLTSLSDAYKDSNIQLEKHFEQNMNVRGDDSRISFVIQTLMNNALSYSPNGGTIMVRVFRSNKDIVCSITDTGIGIPKDELQYIFEKFYRGEGAKQTDTEGMGIGLFISKQIVLHHRGKMWVESEGSGKGSTFSFSLPSA